MNKIKLLKSGLIAILIVIVMVGFALSLVYLCRVLPILAIGIVLTICIGSLWWAFYQIF